MGTKSGSYITLLAFVYLWLTIVLPGGQLIVINCNFYVWIKNFKGLQL